MDPTRRMFIKTGTGAIVASVLGFDLKPAYAQAKELKIAMTTETRGQSSAFIWQHQGRRFPDQKVLLLPARFCDPEQISLLGKILSTLDRLSEWSRSIEE